MIIGTGLIANAFKDDNINFEDCIVFASGVSNSRVNDENETHRELDLIKKYLDSNKKFIYFSTSSIFDNTAKESIYIKHKLLIEEFIKSNFKNYIIYRLPIVVGKSKNPHTLTNYIFNSVKQNNIVPIYKYACRYMIDVEDVVKYVNKTKKLNKVTINLNFNNKIFIEELVSIFEKILNCKVKKEILEQGECYILDNSLFIEHISKDDLTSFSQNYNYELIKKYYGAGNE